jgi:Tfp pilus assembly protein PilV
MRLRPRPIAARRHDRGVSLIEAVVALAVMAFGMVGIVGIQAGLRANADVAKQRSEASRIAQERVERRRAYSSVETVPGRESYAAVASRPAEDVAGTSATFRVVETVVEDALARRKTLVVDVSWDDRTTRTTDAAGTGAWRQSVTMPTVITATPPELTGALSLTMAGSPMQSPRGRNAGVPVDAAPILDAEGRPTGFSRFVPDSSAPLVTWVFNNITGVITQICVADACTATTARLLAGFVRFATTGAPTSTLSVNPPGAMDPAVGVAVTTTAPAAATVTCATRSDTTTQSIAYFCAVPVTVSGVVPPPPPVWSGRANLTGLSLAASLGDATATLFRVCRYTTRRTHTATPAIPNAQHPLDYSEVGTTLSGQNFLVIRAGDGSTAYDCPDTASPPADGVPLTPLNTFGRTWRHQPPGPT